MSEERPNQPSGQPSDKDYGTSTAGETPATPTPDEATEIAENPVGFGEDSGSAEASSVESTDEGSRTSVEEPI